MSPWGAGKASQALPSPCLGFYKAPKVLPHVTQQRMTHNTAGAKTTLRRQAKKYSTHKLAFLTCQDEEGLGH